MKKINIKTNETLIIDLIINFFFFIYIEYLILDKIKRPSCCLVGRSFLIIKEIVDNIRRFRPDNREGQSR